MRYSFAVGTKGMSSPDSRAAPFMIAVGARMGAYEIVGPLGAGGMGEVYRARDTRLGREVALKLIHLNKAQDQRGRDRIEHEARIVASLNHPNILALHDIGTADGTMYIVTELVSTLPHRLPMAWQLLTRQVSRTVISSQTTSW
jgi:serine/threonine protein kinase